METRRGLSLTEFFPKHQELRNKVYYVSLRIEV